MNDNPWGAAVFVHIIGYKVLAPPPLDCLYLALLLAFSLDRVNSHPDLALDRCFPAPARYTEGEALGSALPAATEEKALRISAHIDNRNHETKKSTAPRRRGVASR